jgi:hypothetical protein
VSSSSSLNDHGELPGSALSGAAVLESGDLPLQHATLQHPMPNADNPDCPKVWNKSENLKQLDRVDRTTVTRRNQIRESRKYEEAWKVGQLYLQGISNIEIGRRLNMKLSTVYSRIQWMRLYWKNSAQTKATEVLAHELAKIDLMEKEAWEQWQLSKEDAIEEIEEESLSPGGMPAKRRAKKRTGRLGDKGYLDLALKCLEMRRKLLGLGDEDKAKPQSMLSRVVEIVVDNIDDVPKVLDYAEFESMAAAANVESAALIVQPGESGPGQSADVVIDSVADVAVDPIVDSVVEVVVDHLADV